MNQSKPKARKSHRHKDDAAATADVGRLLAARAKALTRRLANAAIEGNAEAFRGCAELIFPRRDWRKDPFKLPKLESIADREPALAAICDALTCEELTLVDAADLVGFIGAWADVRRFIDANLNAKNAGGQLP